MIRITCILNSSKRSNRIQKGQSEALNMMTKKKIKQRLLIKLDVEIRIGQSRETDNIEYRRHNTKTNKTQNTTQKTKTKRATRTPSKTVG
jgi:hypothetical protein